MGAYELLIKFATYPTLAPHKTLDNYDVVRIKIPAITTNRIRRLAGSSLSDL
jgi:hypothetical protein